MTARRVLLSDLTTEDDKVISQVQGLAGEEFESEVYQMYGLSSNPEGENESIVIENNGSANDYVVLPPCGYRQAEEGETLIYSGKTEISLKENSITIIVGGKQKLEITDDEIVMHSNLQVNGEIKATGDVMAGEISLQNHQHGGVYNGSGTTTAPIPEG